MGLFSTPKTGPCFSCNIQVSLCRLTAISWRLRIGCGPCRRTSQTVPFVKARSLPLVAFHHEYRMASSVKLMRALERGGVDSYIISGPPPAGLEPLGDEIIGQGFGRMGEQLSRRAPLDEFPVLEKGGAIGGAGGLFVIVSGKDNRGFCF
jgi:hypothetical protein